MSQGAVGLSSNNPTTAPALLMPSASVKTAPGTSMVVKVPLVSRKPPPLKYPTICPASLMATGAVVKAKRRGP